MPNPKSFGHAADDSYVEFTVLILKLIAPSYGTANYTFTLA